MDILYEIRKIIAEEMRVPIEKLDAQSRLTDLGVESVDVIEIVFKIEERFDIEFPLNANDDIAVQFETVGSVVNKVQSLLPKSDS